MLCVENLHYSYGTINALNSISFQVNQGEIVALIGANGAGKSTTLLNISGLLHPQSGLIKYQGIDISKLPPHKVVEAGISLVPEGRKVFSRMTVLENLEMGAYLKKSRAEIKESIENVFDRFTRLKERRNQLAGTLSGGEQQMLAIGRALMSKPKLLLMDEPSMGLAPMLVQEIFAIAKEINESGTTVLLVEQNAYMALSIAQHAYVLETGAIVLQGTAKEMANNPEVKKAYLGE